MNLQISPKPWASSVEGAYLSSLLEPQIEVTSPVLLMGYNFSLYYRRDGLVYDLLHIFSELLPLYEFQITPPIEHLEEEDLICRLEGITHIEEGGQLIVAAQFELLDASRLRELTQIQLQEIKHRYL